MSRALRWFLDTEAIIGARAAIPIRSPATLELLRRARLDAELGEHLMNRVHPVQHGTPEAVAAEVYLEAGYWALLAAKPELGRPSAEELWRSAEILGELGYTQDELKAIERHFVSHRPFIDFADLTPEERRNAITTLSQFALRVISAHDAPRLYLSHLLLKRAAKILVTTLLTVALVGLGVASYPQKPDLAMGKPWTTSSSLAVCHPEEEECAGVQTKILFHTGEDKTPWFQFDMGYPVRFSSMTIRNRTDYGQDRALPLAVEVSNDGNTYQEIVRRTERFRVWKPTFRPQNARYIRLRVLRKSYLHLEEVKVHP
ncbi:MAG TPA: discoidin domain-containing protein [Polyangiaceae bacterium]